MNNVRIIPFKPEHIELMDLREHEAGSLAAYGNIAEMFAAAKEKGACGTIMWESTILGAMGYVEPWKGVAEVWVLPCTSIPRHSLIFAKRVKKSLELLVDTKYFHRIQAISLDNEGHDRWHTWLGFKCEGILNNYSIKKENYKMWSLDIIN